MASIFSTACLFTTLLVEYLLNSLASIHTLSSAVVLILEERTDTIDGVVSPGQYLIG